MKAAVVKAAVVKAAVVKAAVVKADDGTEVGVTGVFVVTDAAAAVALPKEMIGAAKLSMN